MEITTRLDGDNIVINIPIELLKFAEESREDPYIINDVEAMVNYFLRKVVQFSHRTNYAEDYSDLEILIDNLFDDAFENGELWLDNTWSYDDE